LQANFADIVVAHIKDGTIDWAKISDQIQSRNYVPNQSGWMANKAGYFEASNAKIRGTITASDISGCIIRGAMMITDTNATVLMPTDADGRNGLTYVCQANADASCAIGRVNATYHWTPWCDIATYEYTAQGFTTSPAGTRVLNNTKRFKHAANHYVWNGSAVIGESIFNSVYLEWILHNAASQQIGAQSCRVSCPSQKWSNRSTNPGTPNYLPVITGSANGINYKLYQSWYCTASHSEGMEMYKPVMYVEYHSYISKVEIWGEFDIAYTGESHAMRARVQITPDNVGPSELGGPVTIERFSLYTQGANMR
ncbi:TPA: hypothetical protein SIA39_004234, partial [Aeromonas sobria]|nr:hypothetical protein [Aeromonas sobria]